jgi:hypothetical protein
MKTTCINFYVLSDENPVLDPVYIRSVQDPMQKFYIAKYKRMPELEREFGRAFWMDGYRLANSRAWGLVGTRDCDNYSFFFATQTHAKQARKQLAVAETQHCAD